MCSSDLKVLATRSPPTSVRGDLVANTLAERPIRRCRRRRACKMQLTTLSPPRRDQGGVASPRRYTMSSPSFAGFRRERTESAPMISFGCCSWCIGPCRPRWSLGSATSVASQSWLCHSPVNHVSPAGAARRFDVRTFLIRNAHEVDRLARFALMRPLTAKAQRLRTNKGATP